MKDSKSKSVWSAQPATGEWNTAANWVPAIVPTNKAVFSASAKTAINFSPMIATVVDAIKFAAGAPSYAFKFGSAYANPALTITGKGIVNHSGKTQRFSVEAKGANYIFPHLKFTNAATAGGSDLSYYAGPESLLEGYGGGIIGFWDHATAGSASFTVRTGAIAPPTKVQSTVGGEVSFSNYSSAATARFTIYGSLGTDGDTFGNTVFHDKSSADHGLFTNVGGTVKGGDGGNTQLYDDSTAANGVFQNEGGTHPGANGGDVAFDGNANGGQGQFHNQVAPVAGANGGVTSFNNNPPDMKALGASAGYGFYHNYGAKKRGQGGGGHTEFTARHGSPTAANGTFINYGSAIESIFSAGHTIFSINLPTDYFPTAGQGVFWNHPALAKGAAAGFTEFTVNGTSNGGSNGPTAGDGTFHNLGGDTKGAFGGYTAFLCSSSAGNATLIAHGGTKGGLGGRIVFFDQSSGGSAKVQLFGNGELDISNHTNGLMIGALKLNGGIIITQLGTNLTGLTLSGKLMLNHSTRATFSFKKEVQCPPLGGFAWNVPYTILTAPNLPSFKADQFSGNALDGVQPTFAIVGNNLQVSFNKY